MEPIARNIILDLLPVYLAGEASPETRKLVEDFARHDPGIAGLLRTGSLEPPVIPAGVGAPDSLESKTLRRIRRSIRRQMGYVALTTAGVLLVPLVAMVFTDEVKWTLFDFLLMGGLLSGTGVVFVLVSRTLDAVAFRAAVGLAVLAAFLLVWVTLAVGILGSENHPANLLYAGVLLVLAIGAVHGRFRPRGLSHALFAAALAQLLVPVIAWIAWRPLLQEPPGPTVILLLNGFFALLFAVSGALFRRVSHRQEGRRHEVAHKS